LKTKFVFPDLLQLSSQYKEQQRSNKASVK